MPGSGQAAPQAQAGAAGLDAAPNPDPVERAGSEMPGNAQTVSQALAGGTGLDLSLSEKFGTRKLRAPRRRLSNRGLGLPGRSGFALRASAWPVPELQSQPASVIVPGLDPETPGWPFERLQALFKFWRARLDSVPVGARDLWRKDGMALSGVPGNLTLIRPIISPIADWLPYFFIDGVGGEWSRIADGEIRHVLILDIGQRNGEAPWLLAVTRIDLENALPFLLTHALSRVGSTNQALAAVPRSRVPAFTKRVF